MATFTDKKRLVSDSCQELNQFAKEIKLSAPAGEYLTGVWYDLPNNKIQTAIDNGVHVISAPELNRKIEQLKHSRALSLHHEHIILTHYALYGNEHHIY